MAERTVVQAIMRWCRVQGLYVLKTHGSVFGIRGMPDLIVLVPAPRWAVPVFFEVKQVSGRTRVLQRRRLELLRRYGAYAEVVHSVEEVQRCIARVREVCDGHSSPGTEV